MLEKQEPLTESYFYILLCLYNGPNHGYGIMQQTAELSKGHVKMMKKNSIRETLSTNPEDKRKRLYELTALGREILENEILRIKHLVSCSDRIIKGE